MKLEGKMDDILDSIQDGLTTRSIAKKLNVSTRTLNKFVSLPENNLEYKQALQESSESYADKAEDVLLNAEADKNELTRARELAQHYRWMASKRNPRVFGNNVDVTSDGEKLDSVTIFQLPDNERK